MVCDGTLPRDHRTDVDRDAIRSNCWIALGLFEANMTFAGRSLVSEIVVVRWVISIGYALGTATRSGSEGGSCGDNAGFNQKQPDNGSPGPWTFG